MAAGADNGSCEIDSTASSKIEKCKRPVFIAHGTADEVIPYAHGEQLFAAANEPKRILSMPGGGHNDRCRTSFSRS